MSSGEKPTSSVRRLDTAALAEASGVPVSVAEHALRQSGHNLRVALVMLKKKVSATVAAGLLKAAKNNLRVALSSRI